MLFLQIRRFGKPIDFKQSNLTRSYSESFSSISQSASSTRTTLRIFVVQMTNWIQPFRHTVFIWLVKFFHVFYSKNGEKHMSTRIHACVQIESSEKNQMCVPKWIEFVIILFSNLFGARSVIYSNFQVNIISVARTLIPYIWHRLFIKLVICMRIEWI